MNSEIAVIKDSMSGMMELIVTEIDSIKRELYLEFGQNQKVILEDVDRIKKMQIENQNSLAQFSMARIEQNK